MNNKTILQEAFKQFDLLEEETFSLAGSETSVEDAREFMDAGDALDMLDVIDPEAETEEDLEDSYIGKVILDCNVCHSKIYKDPEEVVIDDDEDCVNKEEECPFCYSTDGYKVIGQVEPYEEETTYDVEIEPKDEDEIDDVDFEEDDLIEEEFRRKMSRRTNEGLENIDLETGHDKIHISAEEKEDVDGDMLAPLSDDVQMDIEMNQPEDEENYDMDDFDEEDFDEEELDLDEPGTVDYDIDEFDEDTFNGLGESYLTKVYDNVKSFKTNSVAQKGNHWIVEGVIGFKSGKNKNTTFIFESKDADKKGRVRFLGENKQISRGKKSFGLAGYISNKKFFTESLNYNYRQKDSEGKSVRVYGTVRN